MSSTQWRPGVSREILEQRAIVLNTIRQFFNDRKVLEVDTPAISSATVTDPYLHPIAVPLNSDAASTMYLQTSPEYAMKRLLAAGCGDIFQIARAFRDGETGKLHNPEFHLIEWYRLNFDIHAICAELSDLLSLILDTKAADVITYREIFQSSLNLDIEITSDVDLLQLVHEHCPGLDCLDRDDSLTALFVTVIEPELGKQRPVIVTHYPASQASLACLDEEDSHYALRFEAFYKGIELANGFVELTDAEEQQKRFEQDNHKRELLGLPTMPIDQKLLAALSSGLPECSGVALGFDRLLMLTLGKTSISEVLPFSINKA